MGAVCTTYRSIYVKSVCKFLHSDEPKKTLCDELCDEIFASTRPTVEAEDQSFARTYIIL